jgi:ubiquinone/menaquinone biosynthesis C-methylase UbiE
MDNIIISEKAKYERLYDEVPAYTNFSPGMLIVENAIGFCQRNNLKSVIDIGCATGRATKEFSNHGFNVKGLDITLKGVDKEIMKEIKDCFVESPVENIPFKDNEFDFVFCIDFLEHIHPDNIDRALSEIARVCIGYAQFKIALYKDGFGKAINESLHLSLFRVDKWTELLLKHFKIILKIPRSSNVDFICVPTCEECRLGH